MSRGEAVRLAYRTGAVTNGERVEREYLTVAELAVYSGLSEKTLRRQIGLGDPARALPAHRVAGRVLVKRSDFDAWIAPYRQAGDPRHTQNLRELGLLE